jgi:hypothetical protein
MVVAGAGRHRSRVVAAGREADTVTLASREADPSQDGKLQRRTSGWAGLVLLAAVAAGLLGQGAYHTTVQWQVGVLVAAATVLALAAWPPTRDDVRLLPVVAELGLVGLTLLGALLVALARLLWSTRATSSSGAVWAGVVAATAAFAAQSSFDFVWHLPAVLLTVLLLAGLILPAPRSADAREPFRTAPGKESDENQGAN